MVQIYRKKWQRGLLSTLLRYIRDNIVINLPVRRLPRFLIRILYGIDAKFAFLVHPRGYQDAFISLPFFKPLKFFLRRQVAYDFLSHTSPFILNRVRTPHGVQGIVIGQLTVPEIMFNKRKETLKQLERMIQFVGKVCAPHAVVGLGGWFPMVSRRGSSLEHLAKQLDLTITNGHCGTLASIYMTVEKITALASINFADLQLAVIGVGKMGTNVARAFNGKVKKITLIDINEANLVKTKQLLEAAKLKTEIELHFSGQSDASMKDILSRHHVGVCATSTFRNLLKLKDMPLGFIAIDDSRPEALPRDPRKERIVLEGGLLKIAGAEIDYDYGFGAGDNVFGCLGEAFLVALDGQKQVKATVGDVDLDNFFRLLKLCHESGVTEGDLKSSNDTITKDDILSAVGRRKYSAEKSGNVSK